MVLVVIGLLLSAVIPLILSQQINASITGTRAKEEAIKQALAAFVARNGRMPCPAVPQLGAGAALYGVETFPVAPAVPAAANPCANALAPALPVTLDGAGNPATVRGIVPWATLGLGDDGGLDAWGRRFSYQVQIAAVQPWVPPAPMPVQLIGPRMRAPFPDTNQGQLGVVASAAAGAAPPWPNDAIPTVAVIISHGTDGGGGFLPITGAQRPLPPAANVDERANALIAPPNPFVVQRAFSGGANPFDDVVMAVTVDDLIAPLVTSGALPPAQGVTRSGMSTLTGSVANAIAALGAGNYALPAPPPGARPPAQGCPAGFPPPNPPAWTAPQTVCYYLQITSNPVGGALVRSSPPQLPLDAVNDVLDPWNRPLTYVVFGPLLGAGSVTGQVGPPAGTLVVAGNFTVFQLLSSGADQVFGTLDDVTVSVSGTELATKLRQLGVAGF